MRGLLKTMRDAELSLLKRLTKSKGKGKGTDAAYDPKKPKSVNVYVADSFPAWQDTCVAAVQAAYDEKDGKLNDVKIREVLTEKGLIKDKRVMPFVQAFKVGRSSCLSSHESNKLCMHVETNRRVRC